MARILVLDTLKHPSNSGTANIVLSSDETTTMPTVNINGGQIDSTTIGSSNASTVAATTLSTTGDATVGGDLTISGGDIKSSGGTTSISVSGANTTLAGTANNIGTVTAGTMGSAVVYPTGHLIKTLLYTDGTGLGAYEVSSSTVTCMTDTVAVSAVSGRTYSLEFHGQMEFHRVSGSGGGHGYWGIYEPTSDITPGSTSVGTARSGASVRNDSNLHEFGTTVISYFWVAGSTATQYFCLAGATQSGTDTRLRLDEPNAFNSTDTYKFILREYQGNCLTTNI